MQRTRTSQRRCAQAQMESLKSEDVCYRSPKSVKVQMPVNVAIASVSITLPREQRLAGFIQILYRWDETPDDVLNSGLVNTNSVHFETNLLL